MRLTYSEAPRKTTRSPKLRLWLAINRAHAESSTWNRLQAWTAARRYIRNNPHTVYQSPLELLAAFTTF